VARKVARNLKIPFLSFTAPPELHNSMEELKKRRKHGKYIKKLKPQRHDIEIKVDPSKKLKALRFHKSQQDVAGPLAQFPAKMVNQILSREYFMSGEK
jgi:LmbE family N-acetylglucosaminyl deacetylase